VVAKSDGGCSFIRGEPGRISFNDSRSNNRTLPVVERICRGDDMSQQPMPLITARREFCYSWRCTACDTTIRDAESRPGDTLHCHRCGVLYKVGTVIYDNGCVMKLEGVA
jgi:hypothetical protein